MEHQVQNTSSDLLLIETLHLDYTIFTNDTVKLGDYAT